MLYRDGISGMGANMVLMRIKLHPPGGDLSPTIAVCGDRFLSSVAHCVIDTDVGQSFVIDGIHGEDRYEYRICFQFTN